VTNEPPKSSTRNILRTIGWLLVVSAGIAVYRLVVLPSRELAVPAAQQADSDPSEPAALGDNPLSDSLPTPDGGAVTNDAGSVAPSAPPAAPKPDAEVAAPAAPDSGNDEAAPSNSIDAGNTEVGAADNVASPEAADDEEPPKAFLDKDEIKTVIQSMVPAVKKCYEATLVDFPDAEGQVNLSFTIVGADNKGRVDVEEIAEESTLQETKLNECLIENLRNLEFPVPEGDGEVKVRYPFRFSAAE
jgi:hypothetical protein